MAPVSDDFAVPTPVRRRPATRGRGRGAVVVIVLAVILTGIGLAAFAFRDQWQDLLSESTDNTIVSPAANLRFKVPDAPWHDAPEIKREFGANIALRRGGPNSWVAFLFKDYKDRMPRDDEVLSVAIKRLNSYFKGLEWEQRDEDSLAGRPAQRIVFQGTLKNLAMSGECHMMAYGGIAYWCYGWTPTSGDLASAQEEWATLREGLTLLGERDGWTGKIPKMLTATGQKGGMQLRCPEEIWSVLDPTEDADLILVGRDPDDPKAALKAANLTAILQPEETNLDAALKQARELVLRRQKEEGFQDTRLEAVPDSDRSGLPEGEVELGKTPARVARLRLRNGDDRERFLAIAVVARPNKTLVLLCECAWAHRASWEERFGPVLHSLTFRP